MNNKILTSIVTIGFIVVSTLIYNVNQYYKPEAQRQRWVEGAKADNTSIDNTLKDDLSNKIKNDKCIKENSKTGSVFDCTSLKNYTIEDIVIVEEAIGSASGAVPPKSEAETFSENDTDQKIMQKICNINIHNNKSPLCNNYTLYNNLKQISINKGVSFTLMLGISYAESHIGANFAPGCSLNEYYNLGGVKARKTDNGVTLHDYPIPDSKGCRLYKFNSIEDYWTSKANSLKFGYINKGCSTPSCISKYYVLGYGGVKTGWVNRVNTFYLLN